MNWLQNNKPKELIDKIKEGMSSTKGNGVNFKPGYDLLVDILSDRVKHDYRFNHDVFHDLFRKVLIERFEKDQLKDSNKIIPLLKKRCDEHNAIENKYILVTSINLKKNYNLSSRTVHGRKVSFFSNVPKEYVEERKRLSDNFSLSERDSYQFCTVSVTAPDQLTAYKEAAQSLDIIRSLMQVGFQKSRKIHARNKEHEYPTRSIITLGAFDSLHHPSGRAALEQIWKNEESHQEERAISITDFKKVQNNLQEKIQYWENTTFKELVSGALISYIGALDQKDINIRFLSLWSVIERLVKSDDSQKIIKRISFFFEEVELEKSIIKSLREARNKHVHAGSRSRNIEMYSFLLCTYIDVLINFFLENPFEYKDLDSATAFMQESSNIKELDKKIKKLNKEIQICKDVKEFISGS